MHWKKKGITRERQGLAIRFYLSYEHGGYCICRIKGQMGVMGVEEKNLSVPQSECRVLGGGTVRFVVKGGGVEAREGQSRMQIPVGRKRGGKVLQTMMLLGKKTPGAPADGGTGGGGSFSGIGREGGTSADRFV